TEAVAVYRAQALERQSAVHERASINASLFQAEKPDHEVSDKQVLGFGDEFPVSPRGVVLQAVVPCVPEGEDDRHSAICFNGQIAALETGLFSKDGDAFFLEEVSEFSKLIFVDHFANNHAEVHACSFREHQFLPKNAPSLAVALNCGIGSRILRAEVKAFSKLHMVLGANSSNLGLK